jgi:phosphohistidine phosphatase
MKLYLVQHADAKSKDEDPERPLSEKGWTDIRKVAAFITENLKIQVDTILYSGKIRAKQTAEVLARYLNHSKGIMEEQDLNPLDNPFSWIERMAKINEDIIIVGHMPHLNKLSSLLLCHDEEANIIQFQKGGMVCLERETSGIWTLCWMITPQILMPVIK